MATAYVELDAITCGECGVVFGLNRATNNDRRNNGGVFYCTNGHQIGYIESEVQRLQRALDTKKRREETLENEVAHQKRERQSAERREAAAKGQVTRLKNRAKNGVCPCCNRTVAQLARHMKTKHPDYKIEA